MYKVSGSVMFAKVVERRKDLKEGLCIFLCPAIVGDGKPNFLYLSGV